MKHKETREGDECVCSCGLRWDIGEDDPHPLTATEVIHRREKQSVIINGKMSDCTANRTINSINEMLND